MTTRLLLMENARNDVHPAYLNDNILHPMDSMTMARLKSVTTTAPPGSPSVGDGYWIPAAGGSGVWATKGNQLAFWWYGWRLLQHSCCSGPLHLHLWSGLVPLRYR